MTPIRAGFLPLLDAAILIAAREAGFAAEQGIDLVLTRETSWANVRDRISVGQFDAAHLLAPLPIAQNLGLSPLDVPLIAPFALGLGGNAITVSWTIWQEMQRCGADRSGDPGRAGAALRACVAARQSQGMPPITFAVVHDYSGHAYELRYWLASCGINPARDVQITIVPPPLMADALASAAIDGFCVGEPWNSIAATNGSGMIVTTKAAIWKSSPEKVLGLRKHWAEENEETLARLLLALHNSAAWCAARENLDRLTEMLAAPHYVGVAPEIIRRGLQGRVIDEHEQSDFLFFAARAANFPWQSHALWFFSQMVRWRQLSYSAAAERIAFATYRPDLYRRALGPHGVALPGASSKIEGMLKQTTYVPATQGRLALGPDGFFDGIAFDPNDVERYALNSPFFGGKPNH
jgi:NitT/TauT family transport system ATP-binding protein